MVRQIRRQKQKRRPLAGPPPVTSDGVISCSLALKQPKGKGCEKDGALPTSWLGS
jgi:hypothetical protein